MNTPKTSRNTTFSENLSFHPSNPNPLHQGASLNLNNYYRGLKYKTDNSHLAPVAFYTGQIHPVFNFRKKFTRKQAFEQPLLPDQLLKIHQEQIKEKQLRKEQEKLREKEENNSLIQNAQNLMFYDKNTKNSEVYERRKNFANANIEKVQNKLENIRKEKEKKRSETYDYFPFTHGDEVESKHRTMNLKLKEELQNHLKTVENSPINTKTDPIIGVPKFLQSSEYTEIRRTHNFHVEKVMKEALKTYENELNSKEKAKFTEKREKEDQKIQDEIYYKRLENDRKKEIEENLNALNSQIQEKAKIKAKENENKKNLYSTSLEFVEKPLKLKNPDSYYQDYQKFLIEQMKQTNEKNKNLTENERKIDLQMLATVEEHINLEENTAKLTDLYTKSLNKDIWTKQMQIKALEKEVGKAF